MRNSCIRRGYDDHDQVDVGRSGYDVVAELFLA